LQVTTFLCKSRHLLANNAQHPIVTAS
jgi:hypothetical protein